MHYENKETQTPRTIKAMTEERYTTGLESGEWCFFAMPYPGCVFFSKNQAKDASEDRMSNSDISERVSLIFIACLPGWYQQGFRIMVFWTEQGVWSEKFAEVFGDALKWWFGFSLKE